MHYLLGMPLTEVAASLGIPIGTAKSRLHYALAAMRMAVGGRADPEPDNGPRRAGRMTAACASSATCPPILDDLYLGPSPDYRDEALAAATAVRQRPAWTFPGRWLPMDLRLRRPSRVRAACSVAARSDGLALIALRSSRPLAIYVGTRQTKVPAPFGPARTG